MRFDQCLDTRHPAEESIVLRYRNAFTFGTPDEDARFKDLLGQTSIREGARIFSLLRHKGVEISILDETSLMHTKTLKSIDGCVTTAKCMQAGLERVVLETGGNTGSALTAYGTRVGLETFCFMPAENISLLNSAFFEAGRAHLVSVDDPGAVKHAAEMFAATYGLRHIPETSWRYEASRFRGLIIVEHVLGHQRFDWIAQTISAAFGPIGIYWTFKHLGKGMGRLPRFLGVQQEANCPMYRSWKARRRTLRPVTIDSTAKLLARAMYDVKPHTYGTYRDLIDLLQDTRGDLVTISHGEFDDMLAAELDDSGVCDLLREHGIDLGQEIVEKTGLMALAGTLKLIDRGRMRKGTRVLCCLTSGVCVGDGLATPEFAVRGLRSAIAEYGDQLSMRAHCA